MVRNRFHTLLLVASLLMAGCTESPAPLAPSAPTSIPRALIVAAYSYGKLALGGLHTCTLRSDQAVTCWGSNENGQLGVPPSTVRTVTSAGPYLDVSSFWDHTCALRVGDDIECWGGNFYGQVGAPATPNYPYFARATHAGPFSQVAAGAKHTCGLRTDASVTCWGSSGWGETTVPASVINATQLAGGDQFTCALQASDLTCWGKNTYGQIDDNPSSGPRTATRSGPFAEIAASFYHVCALRSDNGNVVCWGNNGFGQVGGAPTTTFPYYATVTHAGPFVQVSVGGNHTCAVRSDGSVTCWGSNQDRESIVPAGLGGVVEVRAGGTHTCARKGDNTITCWGYSGNGQLNVPPVQTNRVLPAAMFSAMPSSVIVGGSFTLSLDAAQVPGHPEATTFTYAFDCGSGYGAFGSSNTVSCPATTVGSRSVRGKVRDQDGDEAQYAGTVGVIYSFTGFLQPVDDLPTLNVVKAGSAVALTFGLGGNQGLAVFATGFPTSQQVSCTAGAPEDTVEQTVTAGGSSLSYDAATQQYAYIWKTDKGWSGTCRTLTVKLIDGTTHQASFKFK
jgi:alpha-tubulin suppressor-like RCC1 family protein